MRLTKIQRILTYISIFSLLFSGLFWLIFMFYLDYESPFYFLKAYNIKLHGFATLLFLITFGMLTSTHLSFNWQVKKNRRKSGLILTALLLGLIISGYLLYYLGDEDWRNYTSYFHWISGIICSVFFIFHFATKSKRKSKKKSLVR